MDPLLQTIINQIPQISKGSNPQITPIAGLTNKNYRIDQNDETYVIRICRDNGALLGINRLHELKTIKYAAKLGVGAELIFSSLPEGHIVTRWIEGKPISREVYLQPEMLTNIVETVKLIHSFPDNGAIFNPFERIRNYLHLATQNGVNLSAEVHQCIFHMTQIEARQTPDLPQWKRFCHNDLYSVNFLDDGNQIRVIDWEFSGMGDLFFDLATLVYAYDSDGPIPTAYETVILETYFGEVTDIHRKRLTEMKFLVQFFTAAWGFLHAGLTKTGTIPTVPGFNYQEFAEYIIQQLIKEIN